MMIHPSYQELMQKINKESIEEGEAPVVRSRYSIVLATSKRARQLNDGETPLAAASAGKALSIAVEELYEGKVKIVSNNTDIDNTHATIVEDIDAKEVAQAEPPNEEPAEETSEE